MGTFDEIFAMERSLGLPFKGPMKLPVLPSTKGAKHVDLDDDDESNDHVEYTQAELDRIQERQAHAEGRYSRGELP
jgi:hypothetical protein